MSQAQPPPRTLRRALGAPLVGLAIVVVLIDDLFRAWVGPLAVALARLAPFQAIGRAIAALPPYGILPLFLVPVALVQVLKVFALFLIGQGRLVSGGIVFVGAEIAGILVTERIFHVGKSKLLTIPLFARCYGWFTQIKDAVVAWLARTRIWQAARRAVAAAKAAYGRVKARLAAQRAPGGWLVSRFAAARRAVGRAERSP